MSPITSTSAQSHISYRGLAYDEFEVKSRSGKTSWTSGREGNLSLFHLQKIDTNTKINLFIEGLC